MEEKAFLQHGKYYGEYFVNNHKIESYISDTFKKVYDFIILSAKNFKTSVVTVKFGIGQFEFDEVNYIAIGEILNNNGKIKFEKKPENLKALIMQGTNGKYFAEFILYPEFELRSAKVYEDTELYTLWNYIEDATKRMRNYLNTTAKFRIWELSKRKQIDIVRANIDEFGVVHYELKP